MTVDIGLGFKREKPTEVKKKSLTVGAGSAREGN
jgi:hypothetical protein